eukprot:TRINITY_DN5991_c0_g1_i1.p1 TRINITY_DN5991_c0_g1~~TRINITY_DN5991_c0_g1_i1.p1  ORF type:complete len:453 (+),score=91.75 TRINITY_DN5991_c0_g1_i1:13-1371(+)
MKEEGTRAAVSVEALAPKYVFRGVANVKHLVISIQTDIRRTESKRPPLNLCVVLDKSGSMSGDKEKNCKIAINEIITNLNAEDKFHFVTYGTEAQIEIEDGDLANKEELKKLVNNIHSTGNTNISAGMNKALEVLLRSGAEQIANSRIFLFSDGHPNGGVSTLSGLETEASKILAHNVNITTFGIGDVNATIMKGIAAAGCGDYLFIDLAENIPTYVGQGMSGMLNIFGKNGILKIRGQNGTVVKKIFGHMDTKRNALISGVDIGDVRYGDLRQILAEVEVTPSAEIWSGDDKVPAVKWEFSVEPVRLDKEIGESHPNDGSVEEKKEMEWSGLIGFYGTDDETKVEDDVPSQVKVSLTLGLAAEKNDKVHALLQANEAEKALVLQQELIADLDDILDDDTTGLAATLKKRAQEINIRVRNEGSSSNVLNCFDSFTYVAQRQSRFDSASWDLT